MKSVSDVFVRVSQFTAKEVIFFSSVNIKAFTGGGTYFGLFITNSSCISFSGVILLLAQLWDWSDTDGGSQHRRRGTRRPTGKGSRSSGWGAGAVRGEAPGGHGRGRGSAVPAAGRGLRGRRPPRVPPPPPLPCPAEAAVAPRCPGDRLGVAGAAPAGGCGSHPAAPGREPGREPGRDGGGERGASLHHSDRPSSRGGRRGGTSAPRRGRSAPLRTLPCPAPPVRGEPAAEGSAVPFWRRGGAASRSPRPRCGQGWPATRANLARKSLPPRHQRLQRALGSAGAGPAACPPGPSGQSLPAGGRAGAAAGGRCRSVRAELGLLPAAGAPGASVLPPRCDVRLGDSVGCRRL